MKFNEWMKELSQLYDKMFTVETKYQSFSELRDYREMTKKVQWLRLKLGLIVLLASVLLYCLMMCMCMLCHISILYILSPFMLLLGVALTLIVSALMYDRGKRTRDMMDDMFIQMGTRP